jgi:hypothetical protein
MEAKKLAGSIDSIRRPLPLAVSIALILTLAIAGTALAAIAYQSNATNQNGAATTLTINKPSGVITGDFLLAQITFEKGSDAGTNTQITPAGWTLAVRTDNSTNIGQAILYKFATASEPASYTWTFNQSVKAAGGILRYTGVRPVDPINVSLGSTGDSGNLTAPSVTSTEANTLLVAFFGIKKTTTLSEPAGMTSRYFQQNLQDVTIRARDEVRSAAGATGTRTSVPGAQEKWVAHSIVLRQASPAAVTLASFTARAQPGQVQLTWETTSEVDNTGFNVLRSTAADGDQVRLDFVPASHPGSTNGAKYMYVDTDVVAGATYWYWIEDVDTTGARALHGPVSAAVSGPVAGKRLWLPLVVRR